MASDICFISPYAYSYFNPGSSEYSGGAERQQYLIAKELAERGYDVSFIVFSHDGSNVECIDGVTVLKILPRIHYGEIRDVLKSPLLLLKLTQAIRNVNAGVYYTRANPPLSALVGVICNTFRYPYIYCVGNDSNVESDHLNKYNFLLRKTFVKTVQNADRVVSQTKHQSTLLSNSFDKNSVIIPNGYAIPDQSEVLPMEDREFVLWVGTIDKIQKKPERFLTLARRLENIKFVMVGGGPSKEYVQQIKYQAEDIENLSFEGFVQPDKVQKYYRRAVALVNTSDYEGFPNVFLEAWRYGTPVLSLYHTLNGELENEIAGRKSGSIEQLVADVELLWHDRSTAKTLGDNARKHMSSNYSLNIVTDRYESLIDSLVPLN